MTTFDIVIPTAGRASLAALLEPLAGARAGRIVVVDDRRRGAPLRVPAGVVLLRSGGRGPAAARNVGWRAASARWVAFLDDDVLVDARWGERLREDLEHLAPGTAASQGRVRVPLPAHRRATDWERNVAGLEDARWIKGSWSVVGGRKRRTYTLTAAGRRALGRERVAWQEFTGSISSVLGGGS